MRRSGLVGTLTSLPASATVLGQVSLFFYIGDVAQWIVDHWQLVTRNAWEKLSQLVNIDLTVVQKDYLTALVFFLPVFLWAYARSRERRAGWEVLLGAVSGITFMYLFSPQIYSDLSRLLAEGSSDFISLFYTLAGWSFLLISFAASPLLLWLGAVFVKQLIFGIGLKKPPKEGELRRLQVFGVISLLIGLVATILLIAEILSFVGAENALAGYYQVFWRKALFYMLLPALAITMVIGFIRVKRLKKQGIELVDKNRPPMTDQERKASNAISFVSYVALFVFAAFPVIQSVGMFEAVLAVLLVVLLWLILNRDARKMNNIAVLVMAMLFASVAIDYVIAAIDGIQSLAET